MADDSVATMSAEVKVVTLPVTVRDKHGQIVRNLTKETILPAAPSFAVF